MAGGMCGGGGACMAGGPVWQGACMAGGVHGEGHSWWGACMAKGTCVAGGVHGSGGNAWQGGIHVRRRGCVATEMATAAGGTRPTGMNSC